MRKPALIRAIYAELRSSLGPDIPAKEILSLAYLIFRSYVLGEDESGELEPREGRRSFLALPVDEAMKDGGWKVLEFETSQVSFDELDETVIAEMRQIIERFLGPQWKHPSPPDTP